MTDTFTCTVCRGTFKKAWTDEEAVDELKSQFPKSDPDDCVLVCDDCFKRMMRTEH